MERVRSPSQGTCAVQPGVLYREVALNRHGCTKTSRKKKTLDLSLTNQLRRGWLVCRSTQSWWVCTSPSARVPLSAAESAGAPHQQLHPGPTNLSGLVPTNQLVHVGWSPQTKAAAASEVQLAASCMALRSFARRRCSSRSHRRAGRVLLATRSTRSTSYERGKIPSNGVQIKGPGCADVQHSGKATRVLMSSTAGRGC